MRHPQTRAERRHNADIFRQSRRMMCVAFFTIRGHDPSQNGFWRQTKRSNNHGNRCSCHEEKTSKKYIRKRRRQLDTMIGFSWDAEKEVPPMR